MITEAYAYFACPVTTLTVLPLALVNHKRFHSSPSCQEEQQQQLSPAIEQVFSEEAPIYTTPAETRQFAQVLRTNLTFASREGLPTLLEEGYERISAARSLALSQPSQYRADRLPTTALVHLLLKRHQAEQKTLRHKSESSIEVPTSHSKSLFELFAISRDPPLDFRLLRSRTQQHLSRTLARTAILPLVQEARSDLHNQQELTINIQHLSIELQCMALWEHAALPAFHSSPDDFVQLWISMRQHLVARQQHITSPRLSELRHQFNVGLRKMCTRESAASDGSNAELYRAFTRLALHFRRPYCRSPTSIAALSLSYRHSRFAQSRNVKSEDWPALHRLISSQLEGYLPHRLQEPEKLRRFLSKQSLQTARQIYNALIQFVFRQRSRSAVEQVALLLRMMDEDGLAPDQYTITIILDHLGSVRPTSKSAHLANYAAAAFGLKAMPPSTGHLTLPAPPQSPFSFDPQASAAYLHYLRRTGRAPEALALTAHVSLPGSGVRRRNTHRPSYSPEFYDNILAVCCVQAEYVRAKQLWRAAAVDEDHVSHHASETERWLLPTSSYAHMLWAAVKHLHKIDKDSSDDAHLRAGRLRSFAWSVFQRLKRQQQRPDLHSFAQRPVVNGRILDAIMTVMSRHRSLPRDVRWFEAASEAVARGHVLSDKRTSLLFAQQNAVAAPSQSGSDPGWLRGLSSVLSDRLHQHSVRQGFSKLLVHLCTQKRLESRLLKPSSTADADWVAMLRYRLRSAQHMSNDSKQALFDLLRSLYTGSNSLGMNMRWATVVQELRFRKFLPNAKAQALSDALHGLDEDW